MGKTKLSKSVTYDVPNRMNLLALFEKFTTYYSKADNRDYDDTSIREKSYNLICHTASANVVIIYQLFTNSDNFMVLEYSRCTFKPTESVTDIWNKNGLNLVSIGFTFNEYTIVNVKNEVKKMLENHQELYLAIKDAIFLR